MPRRRAVAKARTSQRDKPAPTDKSPPPSDAELEVVLGRAKRHWDALLAETIRTCSDATVEWKHYAGRTGWRLVVRRKGRNLGYLKPSKGVFTVSLALSDMALDAVERAGVSPAIIGPIRASPKYPEGRAARVGVRSAAGVSLAAKLIAVKATN